MNSRSSYTLGLHAIEGVVPQLAPVLIVSLLFFTVACSGSSAVTYNRGAYLAPVVNISQGQLVTRGVSIQAADGSFVIESGQSFRPPFQVDSYNLWYTTQQMAERPQDLTGRALNALEIGAERVIVTTPYLDRPLFGVLLLSKVPASATGPAARSYYIDIPESYVREATGGKTSVVYERVKLDGGREWFNWSLWMSDVDFPPLPGGKDRMTSAEREAVAFQNFDHVMQSRLQQQAAAQAAASSDDGDLSWLLYLLLLGGLIYGLILLAEAEEAAE